MRVQPCLTLLLAAGLLAASPSAAQTAPKFKVLGFSTTTSDAGHISYEKEANIWLPKQGAIHGFTYESTKSWADCNTAKLSQYQVVIFFDERPEVKSQRDAIEKFVKDGGGFIATHGAAFCMANSGQQPNWPWYHDTLFQSGEYRSNTWRPTSATLKREDSTHPFMKGIPATFKSSPNEWYRWKVDLRTKKDIKILLSIDPVSFPLGTGPKPEEIWHDGYYPVVWANTRYPKMLYMNMGHNDLNSPGTGKDSETFANETQNKIIINALLYMGDVPTAVAPEKARAAAKTPGLVRKGAVPAAAKDGREYEMRGRELPASAP